MIAVGRIALKSMASMCLPFTCRDGARRQTYLPERRSTPELCAPRRATNNAPKVSWSASCATRHRIATTARVLTELSAESCFDLETVKWYQAQFARRNPEHGEITDPIAFC